MRVRVEGSATSKRPPLVFIHGAGGAATVWLDLFRHFERERRVVALDLPGHGQSDPWHDVDDRGRIAYFRDAVGVACAHLQINKAILVGHSMGGLIALAAAAAYPEKVAGLVMLASAVAMKPAPTLMNALVASPTRQAELLAELGWSPATPRDTVARWFRTVTGADPEVTLADLRAVSAFDGASLLPQVSARTLLLAGADDLLCPPSMVKATGKALRGAELAIVPDAGHQLHLEQPAATIAAIETFATYV